MKKLMLMTCLLAALSASQAQTTFYWPGQPEDNTYAWNGNATASGLGNGGPRQASANPNAFYTVESKTISAEATAVYNEISASDGKVKELSVALQDACGLVTDAGQYYCNCKESQEGSYEALLDGDGYTYFMSAWSVATTGAHYLRADLGKNKAVSSFRFLFRRRSQANVPSPTKMTIYGSNAPDEIQKVKVTEITSGFRPKPTITTIFRM